MKKLYIVMALFSVFMLASCGNKAETGTSVATETESSLSVETTAEAEPEASISIEERADKFEVSEDLQTVVLGRYEQDGNLENGTEPIEWIVLETKDNMALVISLDILDCMPYNKGFKATNWENSSIRKWLNSEFIDSAFTDGEKARIVESFVTDTDPDEGSLAQGQESDSETKSESDNDLQVSETEVVNEKVLTGVYDKLFLLSDFEVLKYLPDDGAIEGDEAYARATQYAISQGVWVLTRDLFESGHYVDDGLDDSIIGAGWWWLRNASVDTKTKDVDTTGMIRENGHDVGEKHDGVRPAMWIVLE